MDVNASVARKRRESIFQINPNRPAKANFIITDLFTNIEEVSKQAFEKKSNLKAFLTGPHILNPTVLLALIVLGFLISLIVYCMDLLIHYLQILRLMITNTDNMILNLGIWVIYCIILTEIGCYISSVLSKDSEGSGIPEMKAILSGVKLQNFMSVKVFFSKFFAVVLSLGSGLSLGKEGPCVHLSAIISHHISKFSIFKHIHNSITLKNQFLAASVAGGIAAVFESPIGGVLFSIEVTATYYIVSNMWRAAFCSIWCALGIEWLRYLELIDFIKSTDFPALGLNIEIFNFCLLGILCGLIGGFFIKMTSFLISFREQNVYPMLYGRYRYTLLICTICGVLTFITKYTQLSDRDVINDMFQSNFEKAYWDSSNLGIGLSVFFVIKIILTILSLSTHLPGGILYPVLTAGAVFGRLFAYTLQVVIASENAGIYAAVGAASLVSATTHTISVAVIVFELTGQIHFFLPMIVSVLISYTVSSSISLSIYDALLEIKGLPYLPTLKPSKLQSQNAKDIMELSYPQIYITSTIDELIDAIEEAGLTFNRIPIIDPNGNLLYDMSVNSAKDYLKFICKDQRRFSSAESNQQFEHYVDWIARKNKMTMAGGSFASFYKAEEHEDIQKVTSSAIDFKSDILSIDDSPFAINETTPLAKLHFLFIMLGLNQVYVINKAVLIGMISRESFTKARRN